MSPDDPRDTSADDHTHTVTESALADDGPPASLAAALLAADERYEERHLLGRGGMGEVHLCFDKRIGRQVALKLRRRGTDDSVGSDRFLREICVQGQLEHPCIVPLYDLVETTEGERYFTMKHVRGTTLKSILAARRDDPGSDSEYSLPRLLGALASVCLAAAFAHARGVVHRDLKPDNIMLGNFGEVYVLDWGIAKIRSEPGESKSHPVRVPAEAHADDTSEGSTVGTIGYTAPEQLRGEEDIVDQRADVYALGAILFEILAGKPLHEGDRLARIGSTLEGVDARVHVRAPERSAPPELDAVCVKATALAREDRYASCRELYEAIERYLEGDRDVERRREMSAGHVERARLALAGQGSAPTLSARSTAIHDLGRALAIDPGNVTAADLLVDLLTALPAEMPDDARAEIVAEERGLERLRARTGAIGFAAWVAALPIALWAGVRSTAAVAAMCLTFLLTSAMLWATSRKPPADGASPPYIAILGALAVASTFTMFGPLVALPGLAGVGALGFSIGSRPRFRWMPLLACSLALLVPLALDAFGAIRPSYVIEGGMMCIVPRAVAFDGVSTYAFLAVVNLALVTIAASFGVTLGTALRTAQRRTHLQSWQLRQLIASQPLEGRAR
jgi:eukaryotic-like serine/threonine-protein kinase